MRKKILLRCIITGIIILSFGANTLLVGASKQLQNTSDTPLSRATWIVDDEGDGDYTSIQSAIDNASAGDIIEVYSGTYIENVIIEKSIYLEGKSVEYGTGSDTGNPILNGIGDDNIISVFTENLDAPVKISYFYITNSGLRNAGVYTEFSRSVVVSYNTIVQCHYGIKMYYSETNQIQGNTLNDNDLAILMEFCNYCTISLNHLMNNSAAIQISVSNSNEIKQNEIRGTKLGHGLKLIRSYVNQITFNNFIDNNKQATFLNCLNYWHDNYWSNKPGILPIFFIIGIFQLNFFPTLRIPWPQFDLRAKNSPNPI